MNPAIPAGMRSFVCEHCQREISSAVEMMPGADGKRWHLCGRCYEDGLRSMHLPKPDRSEDLVVSPEVGEALKKSGWKVGTAPQGSKATKINKRKAKPAA